MNTIPAPAEKPSGKILYDAIEAAAKLSISPRHLWTLTQRGEIKCTKLGRRVLYSEAALQELAK